jgi:hypothetical protein
MIEGSTTFRFAFVHPQGVGGVSQGERKMTTQSGLCIAAV